MDNIIELLRNVKREALGQRPEPAAADWSGVTSRLVGQPWQPVLQEAGPQSAVFQVSVALGTALHFPYVSGLLTKQRNCTDETRCSYVVPSESRRHAAVGEMDCSAKSQSATLLKSTSGREATRVGWAEGPLLPPRLEHSITRCDTLGEKKAGRSVRRTVKQRVAQHWPALH